MEERREEMRKEIFGYLRGSLVANGFSPEKVESMLVVAESYVVATTNIAEAKELAKKIEQRLIVLEIFGLLRERLEEIRSLRNR